ncbi:type II toxin-antitoxin system PrlF family antitoxin [Pseudomonadota bacterium]
MELSHVDESKEIPYDKEIPYHEIMLQMIVSKLTSKSQTTIPQSVRRALQIGPGDEIEYEIVDGHVILTKARTGSKTDDPFRTFNEWSTEADEEAYADL